MAFTSKLYPGEPIFNDSTPEAKELPPPGQSRGLELWRRGYEGYAGVASSFPQELLIPRSEWQARIQEMEETKTRISDLVAQAGLPCKDQGKTNYCWINAPTYAVEIMRVIQNQTMVILSPASVGGPIKGFRNEGGWGKEGLEYIIKHGLVPVDKWPANGIDRQYWTEENKKIALDYRVTEWFELKPRDLDQQISLLLRRIPIPVGLNYWGHEVTDEDAVWLDGEACPRFRNSWGLGWGSNGYGVRQGSKRFADDQVAALVTLAA